MLCFFPHPHFILYTTFSHIRMHIQWRESQRFNWNYTEIVIYQKFVATFTTQASFKNTGEKINYKYNFLKPILLDGSTLKTTLKWSHINWFVNIYQLIWRFVPKLNGVPLYNDSENCSEWRKTWILKFGRNKKYLPHFYIYVYLLVKNQHSSVVHVMLTRLLADPTHLSLLSRIT